MWKWTKECQSAFESCRQAMAQTSVLMHYDPAMPLSLAGDASSNGIGAVISHTMPDGTEKSIAFASRALSSTERNYAQLEKEALSFIFGVKQFHQYLYGRNFQLITDHKPLTAILGPKRAYHHLQQHVCSVGHFQYDIRFKPMGEQTQMVSLACPCLYITEPDVKHQATNTISAFNQTQIDTLPFTASQIAKATRQDKLLSNVLHYTRLAGHNQPGNRKHLNLTSNAKMKYRWKDDAYYGDVELSFLETPNKDSQ